MLFEMFCLEKINNRLCLIKKQYSTLEEFNYIKNSVEKVIYNIKDKVYLELLNDGIWVDNLKFDL